MFTDDFVICRKINGGRSKTEYMCVNKRKTDVSVKMQGANEFKYLGSKIQSSIQWTRE